MTYAQIHELDAYAIVDAVGSGDLSPVEVARATVERNEALNPTLNAYSHLAHEQMLEAAHGIEARRQAGEPLGPLAGVPVAVKDLIFAKDIPMTAGCFGYQGFVPDVDDVVVERLRAADALIVGKTNTAELGYAGTGHNPVFGPTSNPWNVALGSGGSSAGSAAAVAARMAPAALGSDAAGSIRLPAAFCGIYGVKATMGRVPLYPGCRDDSYPGLSSFETFEHIGPMTRTVRDAALVLSVISGPDRRDRHSLPPADFDWLAALDGDLRGCRVAYSPDFGYAQVDPEIATIVRDAAAVFERDLGSVVEEVVTPWPDPYEDFWAMMVSESDLVGMRQLAEKCDGRMSPHIGAMLDANWTVDQITAAGMMRKTVVNAMTSLMDDYDILLSPAAAVLPFAVELHAPEAPVDWSPFVLPMNLTGQPAAAIPAGMSASGLPVGMQLATRRFADDLLLRASAAFEAAAPWIDRYPAM